MLTQPLISSLVIAVSGGSDSMALMHHLAPLQDRHPVFVATVDHQLRREAKEEAQFVARAAHKLGLPHTILTWTPRKNANSAHSRTGRYQLLVAHARSLGANTIALGHTINDQAETLIMRALRQTQTSSTKGLSCMSAWAHYDEIRLWRPLLGQSRDTLKNQLRKKNLQWVEDPSNENMKSERVRTRKALHQANTPFPPIETLARFATAADKTRAWINSQTAELLRTAVFFQLEKKTLIFAPPPNTPNRLIIETLNLLIMAIGQSKHPLPYHKLQNVAEYIATTATNKTTLAHCLITIKQGKFFIKQEQRRKNSPLTCRDQTPLNRQENLPLRYFRHSSDDASFHALKALIENTP